MGWLPSTDPKITGVGKNAETEPLCTARGDARWHESRCGNGTTVSQNMKKRIIVRSRNTTSGHGFTSTGSGALRGACWPASAVVALFANSWHVEAIQGSVHRGTDKPDAVRQSAFICDLIFCGFTPPQSSAVWTQMMLLLTHQQKGTVPTSLTSLHVSHGHLTISHGPNKGEYSTAFPRKTTFTRLYYSILL